MIEIEKLLAVAKEAALEAGEIHLKSFGKKKDISFKSNEFDLVTNVDKESEEKILSILKAYFPDHKFLGEESGCHNQSDSDYIWIIDPLDGTTNYAHNFPHFAVSIGLLYKDETYLGIVYDSCKNELFWAAKDTGAYLNADRIEVSKIDKLNKALLATGFPYKRDNSLQTNLNYFEKFIYEAQAIRRPGAASLDLCYVASGRLDGFWELNLAPWDTAAGACIIREAGGKITNFGSEEFDSHIKSVIATNGLLHEQMVSVIQDIK